MRYLLLSAHYRQPLDWSESALAQAVTTLDRLYRALEDFPPDRIDGTEPDRAVVEALDDDLNTPAALAALNRLARALQSADAPAERERLAGVLRASGALMGLLQDPGGWKAHRTNNETVDADAIDALVRQRSEARARRDFAEADRVRDELDARGIELEDTPEGTRWRPRARRPEKP
jgi:cysteinyl-tRNA synthetase